MQKGLKKFTSFTNDWKKQPELASEYFSELNLVPAHKVSAKLMKDDSGSKIRTHKDRGEARYYAPELPKPPKAEVKNRRISYKALKSEIAIVADYYFESEPSMEELGIECFKESLRSFPIHPIQLLPLAIATIIFSHVLCCHWRTASQRTQVGSNVERRHIKLSTHQIQCRIHRQSQRTGCTSTWTRIVRMTMKANCKSRLSKLNRVKS